SGPASTGVAALVLVAAVAATSLPPAVAKTGGMVMRRRGYGGPAGSGLLAGQDHVAHDRVDLGLPAPAAEYAVMADAGLQVVALLVGLEAGAQVVRCRGLADGADVVALAFHGEQRGAPDRLGIDRTALVGQPAVGE